MGVEDLLKGSKDKKEEISEEEFKEKLEREIRFIDSFWWRKDIRKSANKLAELSKESVKRKAKKKAKDFCDKHGREYNTEVKSMVKKIINNPTEPIWMDLSA